MHYVPIEKDILTEVLTCREVCTSYLRMHLESLFGADNLNSCIDDNNTEPRAHQLHHHVAIALRRHELTGVIATFSLMLKQYKEYK